ncbi:unnamed protein product [Eretmochelys imbricata]
MFVGPHSKRGFRAAVQGLAAPKAPAIRAALPGRGWLPESQPWGRRCAAQSHLHAPPPPRTKQELPKTAKPLQRLSIKHKSIKLFGDFIRSHVHWSSIETKKYSNPMTAKSNFMWSLKTWQAGKVTYKDNCPEAG